MPLKHRIIPILLWNGKQVVQSVQFQRPHRNVGSMMQHIRVMETRNIDELIILDVNATIEKRKPLFDEIKEFTKELFCPVTIGGGITELDDIKRLIQDCGADKVTIKNSFNINPNFIREASNKFGSQAIVFAIDGYKSVYNSDTNLMGYFGYAGIPVSILSSVCGGLGAGEILLTSIDNNGIRESYDLNLLKRAVTYTTIPIIINGGCGHPSHMVDAINAGADAVAASSMFLFTEHTPKTCAKALQEAGIPVRSDG